MPRRDEMKRIREVSTEELRSELADLERQMFDLRAQAVTEKLEDTGLLTRHRRNIARLQTVLRERELAAQAKGSASGDRA